MNLKLRLEIQVHKMKRRVEFIDLLILPVPKIFSLRYILTLPLIHN